MVDNAIPILIEGIHIASFFTGQLFLEPPDLDFFREQAHRFGYDEEAYIETVKKVPVWSREQLDHYLDFVKAFTESLALTGLTRLRDIQSARNTNENENRFRAIVENTEAGYFFIDQDGIIRDVNDSWARLYKYDNTEEVIGHHFAEIQQVDDVEKAESIVRRIMANDPEYLSGEFSRKCKDGTAGYHTFSARPVIRDGTIIGIEGFIIDTTDKRLAEVERDLTQHRLESVFTSMVEGFALHEIICDDKGQPVDYCFLDANPAFERLTGLKANEIVGKRVMEMLPDTEPEWIERYGKVALTGEPVTFESYTQSINRYFRVVAFSNKKGQFATLFEDITERKLSEEKIRTLAYAIESINECVSMTDTKNTLIFVNKAFCQTYGYSREELIGQNISLVRSPLNGPSGYDEILSETIGGGWSGEILNRRKDGTDFLVHISTAVVMDEDNQPVALIGIAVDITERKRNEAELIAAKLKAEESDKLKSAFLANISHEIRTPMNSILGFSELLEEMVTEPQQQNYLKIITKGGERLLNIINSVIDIAKIEAGQLSLILKDFDLNTLMQELFDLNLKVDPNVEFTVDTPMKGQFLIHSDKTKLFQILNNLVSNALKFTRRGFVRFGYTTGKGSVTFFVIDSGIGISDSFKSKVFDRFHKDDHHNRLEFEGTGLGLAITKELVIILKGEIWFDSEVGKGTTFFVRMPTREA
jgi:PAS domain S-box-containing protein